MRGCSCCRSFGYNGSCNGYRSPYIHERKQFGKSIGEFQIMQGKIARYVYHYECM